MKLYQKYLQENDVLPIITTDIEVINEEVKHPKPNPKFDKWFRTGKGLITIATVPMLIPGVTSLTSYLMYLFDITTFKCYSQCVKDKSSKDTKVCTAKCKYDASKWTINYIQDQLDKLHYIKDPKKRKSTEQYLYKILSSWRQTSIENKIKLKTLVRHSKAWSKGDETWNWNEIDY